MDQELYRRQVKHLKTEKGNHGIYSQQGEKAGIIKLHMHTISVNSQEYTGNNKHLKERSNSYYVLVNSKSPCSIGWQASGLEEELKGSQICFCKALDSVSHDFFHNIVYKKIPQQQCTHMLAKTFLRKQLLIVHYQSRRLHQGILCRCLS